MALVSSLFTAISGLRNHQTMLDVISNNVSNVNTIGYKAGRVMFRDMLSQTLSGGSAADSGTNRGGTNPIQTGTGVALASIDTIQTQGALQATGIATDAAIQGDGFFVTQMGNTRTYTRAGMFRFDSSGNLVDPSGFQVQGWTAAQPVGNPLGASVIDSSDPTKIGNITLNSGMTQQPQETDTIKMTGNLDAGATAANLVNSATEGGVEQITVTAGAGSNQVTTTFNVGFADRSVTVYDSLGNEHSLNVHLRNISGTYIPGSASTVVGNTSDLLPGGPLLYDNNTWTFTVDTDPNDPTVALMPDNTTYTDPITGDTVRGSSSGFIHFQTNGALDWVSYSDRNAEHFGATTAFGAAALSDPMNQMAIGFEGATIGQGNTAGDATAGAAGTYDNPELPWLDGNGPPVAMGATFPVPAPAGFPDNTFDFSKLPIVLAYQNIPAGTPVPPNFVSAGRMATDVDVAYRQHELESRQGTVIANAAIPDQTWFVQAVNIDWGSVSTVTNADFDRSFNTAETTGTPAIVGPPAFAAQNPQSANVTGYWNAAGVYVSAEDGIGDSAGIPGTAVDINDFPGPGATWDTSINGALAPWPFNRTNDPNGPDYGWDPRVKSLGNGGRDGLTQDSTGIWSTKNGVRVYTPDFSGCKITSNGYKEGILNSLTIDPSGVLVGSFTNGQFQSLAQMAVATFANPMGLAKSGETTFTTTSNSGDAVIATAGASGRGTVVGGALEQSNVDLSKELTDMIVAQRGFEVNARLVTTSDRILDTLVNLGR